MLLVSLLLAAHIASNGVDAKPKEKVDISLFSSNECEGHPLGSRFELPKDKCVSFTAGSLWAHMHHKSKYNKWIDKVNIGMDECFVTVYNSSECIDSAQETDINVPSDFEKCAQLSDEGTQQSAIKFHCEPHSSWYGIVRNESLALSLTSYSIGDDGSAHPSAYTSDVTATRHYYVPPVVRAEATGHHTLKARKDDQHNIKGVWMKHPWAHSDICYKCWTSNENDFSDFYCRSGPKHPIDCGTKPSDVPMISSSTSTQTSLVQFFFTTTDQFSKAARAEPTRTIRKHAAPVEKRRPWHTSVVLTNPYISNKAICADSTWEKRGKKDAEVRIQDVQDYGKCHDKHAVPLNVGVPLEIVEDVVVETSSTTVQVIVQTSETDSPTVVQHIVVETSTTTDISTATAMIVPSTSETPGTATVTATATATATASPSTSQVTETASTTVVQNVVVETATATATASTTGVDTVVVTASETISTSDTASSTVVETVVQTSTATEVSVETPSTTAVEQIIVETSSTTAVSTESVAVPVTSTTAVSTVVSTATA